MNKRLCWTVFLKTKLHLQIPADMGVSTVTVTPMGCVRRAKESESGCPVGSEGILTTAEEGEVFVMRGMGVSENSTAGLISGSWGVVVVVEEGVVEVEVEMEVEVVEVVEGRGEEEGPEGGEREGGEEERSVVGVAVEEEEVLLLLLTSSTSAVDEWERGDGSCGFGERK